VNGGSINRLKNIDLSKKDFVIWMPNISNDEEKYYPVKKRGSFLICSKVMRPDYALDVPISRIFKMHANAVIAIYANEKPFTFDLVDALANSWSKTTDIKILADTIYNLFNWSNLQQRMKSTLTTIDAPKFENQQFIDLVKLTADKIEATNVGRFFGNASTRCFKTFPSMRTKDVVYVSARNIDKARITSEDMVKVKMEKEQVLFEGKQPSIDTPVQLKLYWAFSPFFNDFIINYIIHGHAYIKDAFMTKYYFPCGDLREYEELQELIHAFNGFSDSRRINLKNHGFIIFAENIEVLESTIKSSIFIQRPLGETL